MSTTNYSGRARPLASRQSLVRGGYDDDSSQDPIRTLVQLGLARAEVSVDHGFDQWRLVESSSSASMG